MRIAILDDYQNVAFSFADWTSLNAEIEVFTEPIPAGEVPARLAGFDVVVAMRERTLFGAEVLRALPDLRLLVSTGRGNAAIDLDAARAAGIVVSNTGYQPHPTAEHTWALILAALRHIPAEDARMRAGGWQHTVGTSLHGKTLGILGLGNLGTRVAAVAHAFGMKTVAWSQNLTAERASEHDVDYVPKEDLLRDSDIITVHLRLSDRTRGLIGANELAAMKPTAWLVNTSRGPIIDEAALLKALHANEIGGAALDVYDIEPLPAGHPLRSAPNTVLTPHLGYVTEDSYTTFFRDAVEDIAAFAAGTPTRVMT